MARNPSLPQLRSFLGYLAFARGGRRRWELKNTAPNPTHTARLQRLEERSELVVLLIGHDSVVHVAESQREIDCAGWGNADFLRRVVSGGKEGSVTFHRKKNVRKSLCGLLSIPVALQFADQLHPA